MTHFHVFDPAKALIQLGLIDDRLEVTNEVDKFGTKEVLMVTPLFGQCW